jgi:NADPH-dependent curcumin reductase CurA
MDMGKIRGGEIRLKRWPKGLPTHADFEIVEAEIREPGDGELLVRNLFMSVDPYMRGRMRPGKSYVAPFELGKALDGGAVGIVVESGNPAFPEGTHVLSEMGFREYFVSDGSALEQIDPGPHPPSAYLGVLGMPGRTAYAGLTQIGKPEPGETVYVSAAAGAVGSAACQIAKIRGCRVVGSAGSREKVRWLLEKAGVDDAFNYREYRNIARELRRQCRDGIDVYFDTVGGDHLEAAIANMNDFGRIVSCGMISRYNDTEAVPGPSNLALFVTRRLRMQGFIVSDYPQLNEPFQRDMKAWLSEGSMVYEQTVVRGIENGIDALIGLFSGKNLGKMIVRL